MKFIEKYFKFMVLGLLFIIFIQECGNSNRTNSIKKELAKQTVKIDSIGSKSEITKAIQIEGLKSEMRMIQSTDRKILDVNRQAEITKELKMLNDN
jgi:hypothetical protein